jgi:hypothetical protein
MSNTGMETGRPKRRRMYVGILVVLLCVWMGWTAISWVLARQAIERYCTGLAPGATIEQARDEARAEGLRFPARVAEPLAGEGSVFVTSSAVFGRYVCGVRHDGEKVTGVALQFVD